MVLPPLQKKKNGEPSEQSSKYEQEQWKRAFLQHHGRTTGRWRLRRRWLGEDLDGNDSSVKDASDIDCDVEKRQNNWKFDQEVLII